jgi:hypothetical protein
MYLYIIFVIKHIGRGTKRENIAGLAIADP